MPKKNFFKSSTQESEAKSTIVVKYFSAWSNVFKNKNTDILFMGLCCGPGKYDDGTMSTELQIASRAHNNKYLSQRLRMLFVDNDPAIAQALEIELKKLRGKYSLTYQPTVELNTIGRDTAYDMPEKWDYPVLTFLDPFGSSSVTRDLILKLTKGFGGDCIVYFNYDRINRDITNPKVPETINAIFGKEIADELRMEVPNLNPSMRCKSIEDAFRRALPERLTSVFHIRNPKNRLRFVILVTKDPLGKRIMNDIMAKQSTSQAQGVASFEHNPADQQQILPFAEPRLFDELCDDLATEFGGKELTVDKLLDSYIQKGNYTITNIKDALKQMVSSNRLTTDPGDRTHRKDTMPDWLTIRFPKGD